MPRLTRGDRIDIHLPPVTLASVASITLKNVPKGVHAALKQQARRHKRSINEEAIVCLDVALGRSPRATLSILDEVRSLRAGIPMKNVDQGWIDAAKRQGRR
jgi:hypothetical protein